MCLCDLQTFHFGEATNFRACFCFTDYWRVIRGGVPKLSKWWFECVLKGSMNLDCGDDLLEPYLLQYKEFVEACDKRERLNKQDWFDNKFKHYCDEQWALAFQLEEAIVHFNNLPLRRGARNRTTIYCMWDKTSMFANNYARD